MSEPAKNTKHVKLKAGDVFEMPLANGGLGYGVAILGGGTPYIIVLRTLHTERPHIDVLASDAIALVGWTMDALVFHGRWSVVFSDYPARNDVPYPNWKVHISGEMHTTDSAGNVLGPATLAEINLLDNQSSRAPIAFQNALEALHDLQPWRPDYDRLAPAYLSARMTRPR